MKLSNLIQVRKIFAEHAQDKLTTSLAYKMMKFIKASDNEDAFYNTKFSELIDKYSKKDEHGNMICDDEGGICLQEAQVEECQKALNALRNTEVESPNIHFSLVELDEIKLSMAEVFILKDLIVEEE